MVNYFGLSKQLTHVIWYYMTGKFPKRGEIIDHMDRNPKNNKWKNLRKVTHLENVRNRKGGLRGWPANVNIDGESHFLEWHNTLEKAQRITNDAYDSLNAKVDLSIL